MLLKNRIDVKTLALGGIMLALSVIFVSGAAFLPTGRLALYSLASFTVSVIVIEAGSGFGWTYYAASSAILFIFIANKAALLPYILFFGFYGILKYYVERYFTGRAGTGITRIMEILIKYVVFNICGCAIVYLYLKITGVQATELISEKLPWQAAVVLAEAAFLVYDFAYSTFVGYYVNSLRKRLGRQ